MENPWGDHENRPGETWPMDAPGVKIHRRQFPWEQNARFMASLVKGYMEPTVFQPFVLPSQTSARVYMYACTYVYIYIYICTNYIHLYIFISKHITCVYIHVYVLCCTTKNGQPRCGNQATVWWSMVPAEPT